MLKFGSPISCPTVTLNKKYKIKFSKKFWVNIDWYAWIKYANTNGAFVYIKKILILHRIHDKSETSKGINLGKRSREDKLLFEKLWPKPIAKFLAYIYKFSY